MEYIQSQPTPMEKLPGRTIGAFNVFSTPYHALRQGHVPVLTSTTTLATTVAQLIFGREIRWEKSDGTHLDEGRDRPLQENVSDLTDALLTDLTIFVSLAVAYGIGSRVLSWNRLSFVSTAASKASQPFLYAWNQSIRVPVAGSFLLQGAGKLISEAGNQFLSGLKFATETRLKFGVTIGTYVFVKVIAPTIWDMIPEDSSS